MRIATDKELARGWWGSALVIALALMVVIGDWILYFIYWSLPLLVFGVFLALAGLIWVAITAHRFQRDGNEEATDD